MAVQDGGQLRKGIELSKRLQRAILRHDCFPLHTMHYETPLVGVL